MKRALFPIACAALAACASTSAPNAPPPAAPPVTSAAASTATTGPHHDARADLTEANGWHVVLDLDHPPPESPPADPNQVIEKVVGGPFVPDGSECPAGGPQIQARLAGAYDGAFSAATAHESLYLVRARACGTKQEKNHLVLMSGDKVLLDAPVVERRLFVVKDLDDDGDNEVLLFGGDVSGDDATPSVVRVTGKLYSLEDAQLEATYDLGTVMEVSCPGGHDETSTIYSRKKGTSFELHVDRREHPCGQ